MNGVAPRQFFAQRWKALFFGLVTSVFFAVLLAASVKALVLGDGSLLGMGVLLVLVVSFGTAAFDYLSVLLRQPVMFQVDDTGIAGQRFDHIPWAAVKDVVACKGRKRHRYLGITLHDPAAYMERQPLMARLRMKLWQWRYDQDLVVEGFLLRTDEPEVMAQAVADLRASRRV